MPTRFDVAVVGSGPSGALAAAKLVEGGARVVMLDVANDDERSRGLIPDEPFHVLRETDAEQRRYFLGDELEGVPRGNVRVGAQLTPPRQYVTRDVERLLPVGDGDFSPMQSLALGGLGASWGAAAFTYSQAERAQIGIDEPGFDALYDEVVARVGVSAAPEDDASARCFAGVATNQPPLDLDTSCGALFAAYQARRERLRGRGVSMCRTPLAVLSEDLGERRANPYFDMDFWSDSRRSVFRPRYLVEELREQRRLTLLRGHLVTTFEETESGVRLRGVDVREDAPFELEVRRVMLCAGAIGSARIALNALGAAGERVPILCNPYRYFPTLHARMLGRETAPRRHSLSQVTALFEPPEDQDDVVVAQFYSYRSLLLFKLVKELPLPPWAGLAVARLMVNALSVIGLHHSDRPDPDRTMEIAPRSGAPLPEARFRYATTAAERARWSARERAFLGALRKIGIHSLVGMNPGPASSIHYAGTLPREDEAGPAYATRRDGRLFGAPRVYAGDGSSWRFLPAKGLTLTLMANARRVAAHVLRDLEASA